MAIVLSVSVVDVKLEVNYYYYYHVIRAVEEDERMEIETNQYLNTL